MALAAAASLVGAATYLLLMFPERTRDRHDRYLATNATLISRKLP